MATQYRGAASAVRSLNCFISLTRAAESLNARLLPLLEGSDLSQSQFAVLDVLHHLGPQPQNVLAQKLLKSGGNITMVIDNLEKRKLVTRVRSDDDRRKSTVHLTSSGAALIKKVFPKYLGAVVKEFSILRPTEQESLRELAKVVGLQKRKGKK